MSKLNPKNKKMAHFYALEDGVKPLYAIAALDDDKAWLNCIQRIEGLLESAKQAKKIKD